MMSTIRSILYFFAPKSQREIEHDYLSRSIDHADLERRMKRIERGQAPFQAHANVNLRDWV